MNLRLVHRMHSEFSARNARRRPDLTQIPAGSPVSQAFRPPVGIRCSPQSEERAESALARSENARSQDLGFRRFRGAERISESSPCHRLRSYCFVRRSAALVEGAWKRKKAR